ncbi:MAG: response regulator [Chloroflexota bacterium]
MTLSRKILQGWNVLAIDDEPDSLEVIALVLTYYGANVIRASNGQEGLDAVKVQRPKLIISDISMPIADGWMLIYELRKNRATMDIPVIALTAHAMAGDRERAIAAGFHNYLTKPLTPATFLSDLLRLLVDLPEFTDLIQDQPND